MLQKSPPPKITKKQPHCCEHYYSAQVCDIMDVFGVCDQHLPYTHTPSIAFQHLPPNSARFSYATEGVLFISAQLSSDTVSVLRTVRVLI